MNHLRRWIEVAAGSAIIWGLVASGIFYALLHAGMLGRTSLPRYCAGHPVAYVEMTLFFVALASLVLKSIDLFLQSNSLDESPLGTVKNAEPAEAAEAAEAMLRRLDRLPPRRAREYYIGRLRAALEYVAARGSAGGLDDELKYLADLEASRVQASYGLFRVVLWAIPILGFLGTVIGITMALNGVDLQAPDQSMVHVLTGLGLKFDTTALALTLSMILMFAHFLVDRNEMGLLERVDGQVSRELASRFPATPPGPGGQAAAVRRMADGMIHAAEKLVKRQADLWQQAMEAANERWTRLADEASLQMRTALEESLKRHAQELADAERDLAEKSRHHWAAMQQTLSESLEALAAAQQVLVRRLEVLDRATDATAQVARMEETLNRNLASLAGAQHFEETVMSLAAAIHLLTARLAETPAGPIVRLESPRRASQAA